MSAAPSTGTPKPLSLFQAFGVELEYMIVDRDTLDVKPIADALFRAAAGHDTSDVEPDGPQGVISWSNELALHVAELKTTLPVRSFDGLTELFQDHIGRIDALLEPMNARLLPTGMHPWMDPDRETRLWPHENNEVYAAYDRIFGCRGHGWGNLQSTHLNLPFSGDEEFGRLHAATRLILPLLPAIAASSPIADGVWTPLADYRLEVYRTNSLRVPLMAGLVVPEPVYTIEGYHRQILGTLYDALAPLDQAGILRNEWANARGCIARFGRGSIEVRLLDIQECPEADLAVLALVIETVRALVAERWMSYADQQRIAAEPLHAVLLETIRSAERTPIAEPALLQALGISAGRSGRVWAADVWWKLFDELLPDHPRWSPVLRKLLNAGTLSTRIGRRIRTNPTRAQLRGLYLELADCLHEGRLFGTE